MAELIPVDHDPFAPQLIPVDHDPFAQPSTAADVAKSGGIGVAKGAIGLAGMPSDLAELGAQGLDKAVTGAGKLFGQDWSRAATMPNAQPLGQSPIGAGAIQRGVEGYTGAFYKPQTTAGKYAETVGEFVPGMALPGGGGLIRRGLTAAGAGVGSEAAGQALEGSPLEPYARVAGAVAGGLAPGMGARAVTPLPASAARQEAVQTLRQEGVTDLTAGDITGSKRLRYFEEMNGGDRAATMAERKAEQFTGAALRRAGIQGETRATPEVIDVAFTRIGGQFDGIAARNNVNLDRNLANELVGIEAEYNRLVNASARRPVVQETIKDIGDIAAARGGVLEGDAYGAIRSRLDKSARGFTYTDPQASEALFGIRNALDDAMARSMTDPADRALLRQSRREWKNMLVLEKAATSAGENAAVGLISPSALASATKNQNRRAYARGRGDFAELSRAGEAVLKPLPNSGTAQRTSAQNMGMGIPGMIGAGVGSLAGTAFGHPAMGAAIGAGAGAMVPRFAGRATLSNPLRGYLGNQAMQGGPGMMPGLANQGLLGLEQQQFGGLFGPFGDYPRERRGN